MRYALIGDLHGNLEALEAVLADIETQNVDEILCLGSLVGYGPNPGECVSIIREREISTVQGAWDRFVLTAPDNTLSSFFSNQLTKWSQGQLSEDQKSFLERLPLVRHYENFSITNSSLYEPHLGDFLSREEDAIPHFDVQEKPLSFIAHGSTPIAFGVDSEGIISKWFRPHLEKKHFAETGIYPLDLPKEFNKLLIHVGSVGRPNTPDMRTSYGIYGDETNRFSWRTLPWDYRRTIAKVEELGLSNVFKMMAQDLEKL